MASLLPGPRQQFAFGERGAVVLFRGAGGLLGSSDSVVSGVDRLHARLQSALPDYFWSSQVFDSYSGSVLSFQEVGSQRAQDWIAQFGSVAAIGGIGYSAGGLSAVRFSKSQAPTAVNLQVQVDSFDPLTGSSPEDEVLPGNVQQGINYYQRRNRFNVFAPGFDPTDLQGATGVQGAINIDAEAFFNDSSITHRTIIDQPALQGQIIQDVQRWVLDGLTFDRQQQLSLTGGAQAVNNLVRLAPAIGGPGRVAIATPFPIDANFSFSTRFEFRLPSTGLSPGLTFALFDESPDSSTDLALSFDPLANNSVSLQIPALSTEPLLQLPTRFDLSRGSLTAWIDYAGSSDQLSVFLSDSLIRPEAPLFTYDFDLVAIAGTETQLGFESTVGPAERQGDLLSWQLSTVAGTAPAAVVPDSFLNLDLTRRLAQAWYGTVLEPVPFEVGGLVFGDLFDEAAYLRRYPDVAAVVGDAIASGYEHFITAGWLEGRSPSSVYSEAYYRSLYPDVDQAIVNGGFRSGFEHFVRAGHREGRRPSQIFDPASYAASNPDVASAVASGLLGSGFEHWIEMGAAEGRSPQSLLFQEVDYLNRYPDVAAAVAAGGFEDGLDHYLRFGCLEQRDPSSLFNESDYLALNPDVAAAVESGAWACGFAHYLLAGRFEARPTVVA